MGDHPRSPTRDSNGILGISKNTSIKEICKAYRFIVTKWNTDKHPSNKTEADGASVNEAYNKATNYKRLEDEPLTISDPVLLEHERVSIESFDHRKSVDDSFFSRSPSISLRSLSRRSKTPNPRSRSAMSRSSSKRSKTPTLSRNMSQKSPFGSETSSPFSSAASKMNSKRFTSETSQPAPSLSRNTSQKSPFGSETSTTFSSTSSNMSSKRFTSETSQPAPSLSRNMSKRSTTPILYSQSTERKKPPPVLRKLPCTLEELLEGCVKKMKITRDVITDAGLIVPEEEILKINVKPGWKKGTKIMFEGKGDEKPGCLPADIIFLIDEKRHPLFERDGDNLEIVLEIPLVSALTGCSFSVPLLGGEKMTLSIDDVIYPGYGKVIRGQGMPNSKEQGRRGDLKIKFLINFPTELSDEQRAEAVSILQECSS